MELSDRFFCVLQKFESTNQIQVHRFEWTNFTDEVSVKKCTYFCEGLVTGYCLYIVKKFCSQPSSILRLTLLSTPCCYGLDFT